MSGEKMELLVLKTKANPLKLWLDKRIHEENGNAVILVTGKPGTGKTYSGLSVSELYDSGFEVDFICFDVRGLLALLEMIAKNPQSYRGTVIMYEEPQQEQTNKRSSGWSAVAFTSVLSTFRSLNCVLIMTTPWKSQLTKDCQDYVDVWMTTQHIDRSNNHCYLSVKFLEKNESSSKTYEKFMRVFYVPTGEIMILKRIAVPLASKKLIKFYEEHKRKYQAELYRKMIKKIDSKEEEKEEAQGTCSNCNGNFGYWNQQGFKCRKCGTLTKRE